MLERLSHNNRTVYRELSIPLQTLTPMPCICDLAISVTMRNSDKHRLHPSAFRSSWHSAQFMIHIHLLVPFYPLSSSFYFTINSLSVCLCIHSDFRLASHTLPPSPSQSTFYTGSLSAFTRLDLYRLWFLPGLSGCLFKAIPPFFNFIHKHLLDLSIGLVCLCCLLSLVMGWCYAGAFLHHVFV